MDLDAARRARRQSFKANLAEAYTDDEAEPPEWIDLQTAIGREKAKLRSQIEDETTAFATEPDIRKAIARRERATDDLRRTIESINRMIQRLNLVAPLPRFTQAGLDADDLIRPLYRTPRKPN